VPPSPSPTWRDRRDGRGGRLLLFVVAHCSVHARAVAG
jgi:hypothetical protein